MQTVIGLGNPGKHYSLTRHNAGWLFLDFLAEQNKTNFIEKNKWKAQVAQVGTQLLLVKPTTFMNLSGQSVQSITAFYKISSEDLFVAFDDLDLAFGSSKIQFGKGPKTHNGLQSIYELLGTDQFWHIRIGVDGRNGDRSIAPHEYVLQPMHSDQLTILETTCLDIRTQLLERDLLKNMSE